MFHTASTARSIQFTSKDDETWFANLRQKSAKDVGEIILEASPLL